MCLQPHGHRIDEPLAVLCRQRSANQEANATTKVEVDFVCRPCEAGRAGFEVPSTEEMSRRTLLLGPGDLGRLAVRKAQDRVAV